MNQRQQKLVEKAILKIEIKLSFIFFKSEFKKNIYIFGKITDRGKFRQRSKKKKNSNRKIKPVDPITIPSSLL